MKLMSLEEINSAYISERVAQTRQGGAVQVTRIASDILFYIAVLIILYTIVSIETGEGGAHRSLMGYSPFVVMSASMQDELPVGSLIIIRDVPASMLAVGDNITFSRGGGITVTHKIIEVLDGSDTGGEGKLRFQTKGTNNPGADNYTVAEADVLGKVVLVLPGMGSFFSGVIANIHIILIIFLLLSLLSFLLRGVTIRKRKHKCEGSGQSRPVFSK